MVLLGAYIRIEHKPSYYYGEPIDVCWNIKGEAHFKLYLVSSQDEAVEDVTDAIEYNIESKTDARHYCAKFTPNNPRGGEVSLELVIRFLDKWNNPIAVYGFEPKSIATLSPVIENFTFESNEALKNNREKKGSIITLSWIKKGKIDYYYLDRNDGSEPERLNGGDLHYDDKRPEYSTHYTLTAHVDQFKEACSEATKDMILYHVPYRPERIFKLENDVLGVTQISLDGLTLYAANAEQIRVIDLTSKQVKALIPMADGVVAMALSLNGKLLYIANRKAASITIVSTEDHREIGAHIELLRPPQVLLSSFDNQHLYVASDQRITMINTNNHCIEHAYTLTDVTNISALAMSRTDNLLFIANPDSNDIIVINLQRKTTYNITLSHSSEYLMPKCMVVDENTHTLFVAVAQHSQVLKVHYSQNSSHEPSVILDYQQLSNPEAMYFVPESSQLLVTAGFKNAVVIWKADEEKKPVIIPTGLNPHTLLMTPEQCVLAVCKDTVFAFWEREKDCIFRPILFESKKQSEEQVLNEQFDTESTLPEAMLMNNVFSHVAKALNHYQPNFFLPPSVNREQPVENKSPAFWTINLDTTPVGNVGYFFPSFVPQTIATRQHRQKAMPQMVDQMADETYRTQLHQLLDNNIFCTKSFCILEKHGDPLSFRLIIPAKTLESQQKYHARIIKIRDCFVQLSILTYTDGISMGKMGKQWTLTFLPQNIMSDELEKALVQMTGLSCVAAEDEAQLTKTFH